MKLDSEKIFLIVLGVALVALVVHKVGTSAVVIAPGAPAPVLNEAVLDSSNKPVTNGPQYLTAATPWGFAPPVGNFLPSVVAGRAGATQIVAANTLNQYADADCGCGGL
jgi:hypothetical protein